MLGWVLFKFTNLSLAGTVFRGLLGLNGNALSDFSARIALKNNMYFLVFCLVAATPLWQKLIFRPYDKIKSAPGRIAVYGLLPAALLLLSTAALVGNSYNPFLYFKF